MDLLRPSTKNS